MDYKRFFLKVALFSLCSVIFLLWISQAALVAPLVHKSIEAILHKVPRMNYSNLPLCPENPPSLIKDVYPEKRLKAAADDPTTFHNVQMGGSYRPRECNTREHVAIVVPYRDREEHLKTFLIHMHQFLQKQQLQYTIFVAEMTGPTIFNTGLMQNIGFEMAYRTNNFTCYIIHDIDLMPVDENNLYRCGDEAVHLMSNSSKFLYKKMYKEYFGGAVALTADQFKKANGYSNLYFGWGGQDDDFYTRVIHSGTKILKTPMNIGRYQALDHERDKGNPINPNRFKYNMNPAIRMAKDGLNSMKYKLLKHELKPLYTWVLVEVNKTEVLKLPNMDYTLPVNSIWDESEDTCS